MSRLIAFVLLISSTLWGQTAAKTALAAENLQPRPPVQAAQQQPPAGAGSDLAQMRNDLNQMDSLLGNMSSEIEFLRDQNLQILLRSNARMWTILIRDLRSQLDRAERDQTSGHNPTSQGPAPAEPRPR